MKNNSINTAPNGKIPAINVLKEIINLFMILFSVNLKSNKLRKKYWRTTKLSN